MEKKIMDQIDKAYEIVQEKSKNILNKYETLNNEILTPEIKEMIIVLKENGIRGMHITTDYECKYNSDKHTSISFINGDWGNEWIGLGFDRKYCPKLYGISGKEYTSNYISVLKSYTDKIIKIEKELDFIERHAKDLIDFITESYRNLTEKQNDILADILSNLDYEEEPIKHIKVTVEWV